MAAIAAPTLPSGKENGSADLDHIILGFIRKILKCQSGSKDQLTSMEDLLRLMKLPGIMELKKKDLEPLKKPFRKASAEGLTLIVPKFILLHCDGKTKQDKVLEGLRPLCTSLKIEPIEPTPEAYENNRANTVYRSDSMVTYNFMYICSYDIGVQSLIVCLLR